MFLDRDGVLNELLDVAGGGRRAPWTTNEVRILPGAAELVFTARNLGYEPVVVSNQPDIAAGAITAAQADEIDERIRTATGVVRSILCPHRVADACACRKPLPGMLLDAMKRWDLMVDGSWLVGDRWVDIAAGRAAGVSTILLQRHYSWLPSSSGAPDPGLEPDATCATLEQVALLLR